MQPIWLEPDLAETIHDEVIERFGGSYGIRDKNLLESALARSQHLFTYEQPSMFELAAAYGYGITKNHPFVDGNKRTALVVMIVFLEDNGYGFEADEAETVVIMERLADSLETQETLAQWLKENSKEVA